MKKLILLALGAVAAKKAADYFKIHSIKDLKKAIIPK